MVAPAWFLHHPAPSLSAATNSCLQVLRGYAKRHRAPADPPSRQPSRPTVRFVFYGTVTLASLLFFLLLTHHAFCADYFPNLSRTHLDAGNNLLNKGELDDAIREFRAAVWLYPHNAEAYYNLGYALGRKGDLDGAIAAYQQAVQLKPNDPGYAEAYVNLAHALRQRGDLDGAIAAWRKAVRLKPEDNAARTNLGIALRTRGDLEQVIAAWQEAIRLQPDEALTYFSLGIALQQNPTPAGRTAAGHARPQPRFRVRASRSPARGPRSCTGRRVHRPDRSEP